MSDFVDFNLAVKLKEKGYPQKSFGKYSMAGACYFNDGRFYEDGCIANVEDCCSAPTISQVLKWLREEKNLSVEPYSCACGWRVTICKTGDVLDGYVSGGTCVKNEVKGYNDGGAFNLYEEAAIAGIEYVLDNLI